MPNFWKGEDLVEQARVMVGVPCGDQVQAVFAYSLAGMMAHTMGTLVGPTQPIEWIRLVFHRGTLIAPQRYELALAALGLNATHLLWIDSDTEFPPDALNRLLARNKDYVGIVQCGRRPPCGTTSFIWEVPGKPTMVYTYPESTGLQRVDALGFGFTLCRTEVFRKVPPPFFPMQWGQMTNGEWQFNGEDVGFQSWVRKAGFEMWVDHDLSKECGHAGAVVYKMEHALAMRDAMVEVGTFVIPPGALGEYKGGADLIEEKPKLVLVKE